MKHNNFNAGMLSKPFLLPQSCSAYRHPRMPLVFATASVPSESKTEPSPQAEIHIKSDMGIDFQPLKNALAAQDFLTADQITRDTLIKMGGQGAEDRNFVYFTEVAGIPEADLATMERLWLAYSQGKFGYSVQRRIFNLLDGDFERLFERIGWLKDEKLLRWTAGEGNEFLYDLKAAPKGHLPLTSTLRGTQLLQRLYKHPVWNTDEFKSKK